MEPGLQQTGSCGALSPAPAMQMPPDSVASAWRSTRSWRTTSHRYFYLSTVALVCLVVAMAIILVLVVQKKVSKLVFASLSLFIICAPLGERIEKLGAKNLKMQINKTMHIYRRRKRERGERNRNELPTLICNFLEECNWT